MPTTFPYFWHCRFPFCYALTGDSTKAGEGAGSGLSYKIGPILFENLKLNVKKEKGTQDQPRAHAQANKHPTVTNALTYKMEQIIVNSRPGTPIRSNFSFTQEFQILSCS